MARVVGLQTDAVVVTETRLNIFNLSLKMTHSYHGFELQRPNFALRPISNVIPAIF